MPIKQGETLPSVELQENTPANKVNIRDLFKGKKGIIFGVPGAYTPTCSNSHLPGFVADYDKLKDAGVDVIACVSVNDAFVMSAWGKDKGVEGKVRMLADPTAAFTKAIDVGFDATAALGGVRSQRYAMVVEDGVVKAINVEPDKTGLSCSAAKSIFSLL